LVRLISSDGGYLELRPEAYQLDAPGSGPAEDDEAGRDE
jgi:hypothetical protein